jgi:hypothetical protein
MVLLISLVLGLIPLLGVVWMASRGSVFTVDGLFMSLILLAISGMFGGNALAELRKRRSAAAQPGVAIAPSTRATGSEIVARGKVERVEFFESSVGQPNKSIVTLSARDSSRRTLVLEGDVRNALPSGQKVEITFRKAQGNNVLVEVGRA